MMKYTIIRVGLVFTILNLLIYFGTSTITSASDYESVQKSVETIKVEEEHNISLAKQVNNNRTTEIVKNIRDNAEENDETLENKTTGIIFIGDSRTVGMDKACNISDNENEFVVARVGKGYNYLVDEALPEVESIRQQNESIDDWVYIINLGVNDLGNVDKYKEKYEEIARDKQVRVYIESVNPVKDYPTVSNEQIEKINNTFKHINNTSYIDVYNYLLENGFETADGLHYKTTTSRIIYEKIKESIK